MELEYKIQQYEWGKKGSKSTVAILSKNANPTFEIDENQPYAELWIGTHINGPSTIKETKTALSEIIERNPQYLGDKIIESFGKQLPFLFKVLSVNTALSIQAHPSKKHAEQLHIQKPNIYKDSNHKPELAIALTPFEALCGFRPIPEIISFFKEIPELKSLIPDDLFNNTDKEFLKKSFKTILTTPKDIIAKQLTNLVQRLKNSDSNTREKQLAGLIEKLYSQYPNDVGCFVTYFLNHIKLKPFEAIYLGANEPHAYIYGDCIECMACSDNVVRAGLTPKLIDVDTLCSMLIYVGEEAKYKIFQPQKESKNCQKYAPPLRDFAVVQITVLANEKCFKLPVRQSASTILVISGSALINSIKLIPGTAIFVPAGQLLEIVDIKQDLLIFQAMANFF